MKILFLIRSLYVGGAERQLVTLANGLRQRGHAVSVAVFYSGGPLEKELADGQTPVHALGKRKRWDIVGFLWRLVTLVKKESPDVLYAYLVEPNLLTVLLKLVYPKIKMVWGVRAANIDLGQYDAFIRMTFQLSCWLARFADLIIVNSQTGMMYHRQRGYPEHKMIVIPNGIDTNRFLPDPVARRRIRAEWGIKEPEKLIGLVARMDPVKDYPTFLKAASLLAHERPDVRFVCVGDDPADMRVQLQSFAATLRLQQKVVWAGLRVDMPSVYNALDILCSSSAGEGMPNIIGEAMACGIPCIATDVGDCAEIVGPSGVIVPPKNPQALAKGMQALLTSAVNMSPDILRRRIVECFSTQRLITATEQTLTRQRNNRDNSCM